jgi:hypothetical protein
MVDALEARPTVVDPTTTASREAMGGDLGCDTWIDDRTALIVDRHEFANLFHNSEDFFNAFLSMAILRRPRESVQLWLTDLYPKGPFWPVWSEVFDGGQHPPLTAWDIAQRYGKVPSQKQLCFSEFALSITGPAAPITLAGFPTDCFGGATVRAYADFMIRGLGLQDKTLYANRFGSAPDHTKKKKDRYNIMFVTRRPSVVWPERAYCSDSEGTDGSFFKCRDWEHRSGNRPLERMVDNEDEVLAALEVLAAELTTTDDDEEQQQGEGEGEGGGGGHEVTVTVADFNVMPFKEQVLAVLEADVMIGPHGAGLTHAMFLAHWSLLIELKVSGSNGRFHFNNQAQWSGHEYRPVNVAGNTVRDESLDTTISTTRDHLLKLFESTRRVRG